jgi:uncharacterized membrane protein YidH (DUF202 family)
MVPERTEEEQRQFSKFLRLSRIHMGIGAGMLYTGSVLIPFKYELPGLSIVILGMVVLVYYYNMWQKGKKQYCRTDK